MNNWKLKQNPHDVTTVVGKVNVFPSRQNPACNYACFVYIVFDFNEYRYCKRHTCSVPNCGLGCSSSDEKCAKHAQEAVVELDAYTTYLTDPPKQRQITVRRPSDEPERLPLPPRPTNVQKQEDSDYQNIRRKATAESSFGGFDDERTYDTVGCRF